MKLVSVGLLLLAGCWSAAVPAETELQYNQVRFQVRAIESVANDHMQAVLVAQDEGGEPARLADRINATMAWALAQTRGAKGIDVRSGGYTTQPVYRKDSIDHWRATQELILSGSDFARIGDLIGALQEKLQLRAVSFSVSAVTRERVERELIDRALDGFKQRADQVRSNIGTKGYRIVELNILTEDTPVHPAPMMRAEAMSMSVTPPSFEGGDSELRVTVQGLVQLD